MQAIRLMPNGVRLAASDMLRRLRSGGVVRGRGRPLKAKSRSRLRRAATRVTGLRAEILSHLQVFSDLCKQFADITRTSRRKNFVTAC